MAQLAAVIRELRTLFGSISVLKSLQPFHLHFLFGGLGIQVLEEFLWEVLPFSSYEALDLLFNDIPLSVIGFYGFFLGCWLTLISDNLRLLCYGLWGYALLALFPFDSIGIFQLVRAIIYAGLGYFIFQLGSNLPVGGTRMTKEL